MSPTDEPNQLTVETINLILCIESQIHIHEYLTPHTHTHTHTFGTPLVRCLQRPSWPILCIVGKKKNGDFELTSGNYFNGKILYFLFFVFNLTNLPDRRGEIWSFEKDFLLLLLLLLFFFFDTIIWERLLGRIGLHAPLNVARIMTTKLTLYNSQNLSSKSLSLWNFFFSYFFFLDKKKFCLICQSHK